MTRLDLPSFADAALRDARILIAGRGSADETYDVFMLLDFGEAAAFTTIVTARRDKVGLEAAEFEMPDGSRVLVMVNAEPIPDAAEKGKAIYAGSFLRDATEDFTFSTGPLRLTPESRSR